MGPQRPAMLARDSSGKSISLLNNETSSLITQGTIYESQPHDMHMARSQSSNSKNSSSPPSLIRESSYDSRQDHPITPTNDYIRSPYTQTQSPQTYFAYPPPPPPPADSHYPLSTTTAPHYPPPSFQPSAKSPLPCSSTAFSPPYPPSQKKYECKYRIQHGCDQTFTTSGHASRHSKIHDSLKAISCTHAGCAKKFTRSDNMKQHLETHNKDKKREKGSRTQMQTQTQTMPMMTGRVNKSGRPDRERERRKGNDLAARTTGGSWVYPMHVKDAAADDHERRNSLFHASPTSPGRLAALDVLAEAADREKAFLR